MLDHEPDCFSQPGAHAESACRPVHTLRPASLEAFLAGLTGPQASFLRAAGITGEAGQMLLLPDATGLAGAVLGLGSRHDPYLFGGLAAWLPGGAWRLQGEAADLEHCVLGWALGAYRYDRRRQQEGKPFNRLVLPLHAGAAHRISAARATWLARDLINMPANRLGPLDLAHAARDTLHRLGAHVDVIAGESLELQFPAVQAVGMGSARPPCVLRAGWRHVAGVGGGNQLPLVSICGKGVCFDTGGYDIKPPAGMLRMKKDMGGAAIALGLACMIIEADLPVRLELKLGCVENMISGSAMRPLDVITTRSGLQVEVGNTDAEGRLVLCDLLTEACESHPDLLLDFATLTGAARVALGPDLPALFTKDDATASLFTQQGAAVHDPVWRLPLWDGYNSWLESNAGDLNNVSEKAHAGAVIAALFLQRFVSAGTRWAHFDVYAWNDTARPGRPAGGEAQAMRAAFAGIAQFVGRGDGVGVS